MITNSPTLRRSVGRTRTAATPFHLRFNIIIARRITETHTSNRRSEGRHDPNRESRLLPLAFSHVGARKSISVGQFGLGSDPDYRARTRVRRACTLDDSYSRSAIASAGHKKRRRRLRSRTSFPFALNMKQAPYFPHSRHTSAFAKTS